MPSGRAREFIARIYKRLRGSDATRVRLPARMQFAFVVMCLGLALVFADQNLLAPNLTAIANDLDLSPEERDYKLGGQIAFAFFLLGAPAAILIGSLADYYSRTKLFAWTLLLGSCPNVLAWYPGVTTFGQLYWLRALTGIAVGGAAPLTYSLSSDLFPPSERTKMSAVTGLSMTFGVVGGQAIAGFLGERYGWRLPFAVVAVPGMCVAMVLMFFVEEPVRGGMEEHPDATSLDNEENEETESLVRSRPSTPPIRRGMLHAQLGTLRAFAKKVNGIVSVRTVQFFLIQGIAGCVPWSMINTFFNDYLAQDKGLGVQTSTTLLIAFAIGGMVGTIFAGWYGQILYNDNPVRVSFFMGTTAFLGCIPTSYLVLADYSTSTLDVAFKCTLAFITGGIACCVGVNIRALLLNVLHPINRGTAFSLFMLTDDLGRGLGPVVVAMFVSMFGRETAFFISVLFWIPCAILLVASSLTLQKDLQSASIRYQNDRAEAEGSVRID